MLIGLPWEGYNANIMIILILISNSFKIKIMYIVFIYRHYRTWMVDNNRNHTFNISIIESIEITNKSTLNQGITQLDKPETNKQFKYTIQ